MFSILKVALTIIIICVYVGLLLDSIEIFVHSIEKKINEFRGIVLFESFKLKEDIDKEREKEVPLVKTCQSHFLN